MFFILLVCLLLIAYLDHWQPRDMGNYYLSFPMMIAHRGIKINSPENTISAFREAVNTGFEAIEIDVISTKDGTRKRLTQIAIRSCSPKTLHTWLRPDQLVLF